MVSSWRVIGKFERVFGELLSFGDFLSSFLASFGELLTKLGEFRPVYGKSVRVLSSFFASFLRVLGEFCES